MDEGHRTRAYGWRAAPAADPAGVRAAGGLIPARLGCEVRQLVQVREAHPQRSPLPRSWMLQGPTFIPQITAMFHEDSFLFAEG